MVGEVGEAGDGRVFGIEAGEGRLGGAGVCALADKAERHVGILRGGLRGGERKGEEEEEGKEHGGWLRGKHVDEVHVRDEKTGCWDIFLGSG